MHTRALRAGIVVAGVVGLVLSVMVWRQVDREREAGFQDLERRAAVLAHRLSLATAEALRLPESEVLTLLRPAVDGYRRLIGLAVYGPDGRLLCAGDGVSDFSEVLEGPVKQVLAGAAEVVARKEVADASLHVLARSFQGPEGKPGGVVAVLHDSSYVHERATAALTRWAFSVLLIVLLVLTVVTGLGWFAYEKPLRGLADWMRRLRMGEESAPPPAALPLRSLAEESGHLAASLRAARTATWAESRHAAQADKVWTSDRLRAHATDALEGSPLVVVSNREPYMHVTRDGKPHMIVPASGLVTALDPVLQACGGLGVAHGAGDADREAADSRGRLSVPPDEPRYALRRVWLSREQEQGYYYGFSNEGLWPLCHLAHERPVFRGADWKHYVEVNRRFAQGVLEEVGGASASVWVQDYHLALVPHLLKSENPELRVGIFWHIPWPNPEAFRICPWREEILEGMLGADLVGFHLQQHCNNFLDTVDRMVEARLDWDHFAVDLKGHTTQVRPFPISVQDWTEREVPQGEDLGRQIAELKDDHNLHGVEVAVGVDRIDYTKGLPERFRAVARFFEKHPAYRGRLTFVQLGAPSRTHIRRYRDLLTELESLADEINWKFQSDDWKPIRFLVAHHDARTVHAFLAMASLCLVSSLHDGMNLVAKEFVSAQEGGQGVLVLSEFAGAARELSDALVVNPYDIEQCAEAIRQAVEMEPAERRRRMERMRKGVQEHNVYRWAGTFISELSQSVKTLAGEMRHY